MGNSFRFAGYLGRVFLVNAVVGAGVATGMGGAFFLATRFAIPQLKKIWDAIPEPGENELKATKVEKNEK